MDKKAINNEIVRMRPIANKAKVCTICKLNREVKSLRKPRDYLDEAHKKKNTIKAGRLVEELLAMKKIKHDDISKFALTHSKKQITAIQSKPDSSVELRCLSRLALHVGLSAHVNHFQSKFPKWESSLVPLIENIGVKEKRKKPMTKLVALKPVETYVDEEMDRSSVSSVNSDLDEKESDDASGKNSTDDNILPAPVQMELRKSGLKFKPNSKLLKNHVQPKKVVSKQSEDMFLSKQPTAKVKSKKLKTCTFSETIKNSEKKLPERNPSSVIESSSKCSTLSESTPKKVKRPKNIKEVIKKGDRKENKSDSKGKETNRNKIMKVMKFTELLERNQSPDPSLEIDDNMSLALEPRSVDSFFVTHDGKSEFLSLVPATEISAEKSKLAHPAPHDMYDFSGRRLNRREMRAQLRGDVYVKNNSRKPFPPKGTGNYWENPEVRLAPKWKNNVQTVQPNISVQSTVEILHPSWEAKKKQKDQLNLGFQGKKIKFDD